ncbi:hypothetical protein KSP39_PZI019290 [Platanthera zijinensis]|uniref:Uncharacterized protein n=1 Tax=Platanthera zijinensis TaxID=2320716 RepID=A0AAP0B0Y0_9ASPA
MGAFTKAPSKPKNSSKYTSRCRKPRCRNCHDHPVTKARAKVKGSRKHNAFEVPDFFLKSDCGPYDQACVSDDGSEDDAGARVATKAAGGNNIFCLGGSGGDDECEDGKRVFVEGVL